MEKADHGNLLARAMGAQRKGRQEVAAAAGVKVRTVTNWTTGTTMPSERERSALHELLGPYDILDPVEEAVRRSELTDDRQDTVLGFYKRQLREQREAGGALGEAARRAQAALRADVVEKERGKSDAS